jgi:ABC-type molybdate transport system substrate-binding protein
MGRNIYEGFGTGMVLLRRSLLGGMLASGTALAAGHAPEQAVVDTTDLALACAAPLGPVMRRAAEAFREVNGVRVHVFPIGAKLLAAQLRREVQIDLVATRLADMQELAEAQLLAGPPFTGPWRDRLVIAGRRGTALAVAMQGTVAVPDAGTACDIDGPQILGKLGMRPQRRVGVVDTTEAAAMLLANTANGALLYLSEVRAEMLLAELAPVPEAVGPDTRVALAIAAGARRPNPQGFVQFLGTNSGRRLLSEGGLEDLA